MDIWFAGNWLLIIISTKVYFKLIDLVYLS